MSTPSFSRRQALRWAGSTAMATTFLPFSGQNAAWSHPAEQKLATRLLGRTGREVTTFGLAGGNKVMWRTDHREEVRIIVKAINAGMTYLETANNYQKSQLHYGEAFRQLDLIPGKAGYDRNLRNRLFVATKTALRYADIRDGSKPLGGSQGGGKTAIDDLKRSMTQFWGDGKGQIPEGAYIDLMQVHTIGHPRDVHAAFEGYDNPGDKTLPRIGAIAGLLDYRDGTNLTGLNPEHKKWIRHIGITGHENPLVHMLAMRKDTKNVLDTLLVVCNPNDVRYFSHQTNSIPVAAAKGMGIIAMKVFADGVMYGLDQKYAHTPGQSVPTVGQAHKVDYKDFVRYSLNPEGMSTCIAGIGLTDKDDDPDNDQLVANLAAAQVADPLSTREKKQIEAQVAALHGTQTNFFQRPSSGFMPAQNVRVERENREAPVKVMWDTAYAGADPIVRYEVYRRETRVAEMPWKPQLTEEPFSILDPNAPGGAQGGLYYRVNAIDTAGNVATSMSVRPV